MDDASLPPISFSVSEVHAGPGLKIGMRVTNKDGQGLPMFMTLEGAKQLRAELDAAIRQAESRSPDDDHTGPVPYVGEV